VDEHALAKLFVLHPMQGLQGDYYYWSAHRAQDRHGFGRMDLVEIQVDDDQEMEMVCDKSLLTHRDAAIKNYVLALCIQCEETILVIQGGDMDFLVSFRRVKLGGQLEKWKNQNVELVNQNGAQPHGYDQQSHGNHMNCYLVHLVQSSSRDWRSSQDCLREKVILPVLNSANELDDVLLQ